MSPAPYFSVIVPAYRQARTICDDLVALRNVLANIVPSYEIILVVDGNEDHTFETVIQTLAWPELRVECFADNYGKGVAVRHGFQVAQGELIAFMDAGGDIEPHDFRQMIATMQTNQADIIIGSKRHSSSQVSYPRLRRVYSYLYQRLNRLLFQLEIRDTQVGMKLFRPAVIQAILPLLKVERYAFDLELLVVAHHLGFRRIIETPITIRHRFSSSVSVQAVYQMLWDTFVIFYRSRILKSYDRIPRISLKKTPNFSPILVETKVGVREVQSYVPARRE
jgi:glycosyltransferase involved in cell wall biosynthesis